MERRSGGRREGREGRGGREEEGRGREDATVLSACVRTLWNTTGTISFYTHPSSLTTPLPSLTSQLHLCGHLPSTHIQVSVLVSPSASTGSRKHLVDQKHQRVQNSLVLGSLLGLRLGQSDALEELNAVCTRAGHGSTRVTPRLE